MGSRSPYVIMHLSHPPGWAQSEGQCCLSVLGSGRFAHYASDARLLAGLGEEVYRRLGVVCSRVGVVWWCND